MKTIRTVIVMPDLIRHPWIAGQARNDSLAICK